MEIMKLKTNKQKITQQQPLRFSKKMLAREVESMETTKFK